MEGIKLKDYKLRSGELNRTWNCFPASWHLADGLSGHIEYHRNREICIGENELQFQWPLQSCLASWPYSLPSWLPQHSFQTGLPLTVAVPRQLFSEDLWHVCKIHAMDVDWTVLQVSTERGFSSIGTIWNRAADQLYISQAETDCIPDLVIVAKSCKLGESTSPGLWPLLPMTTPNRTYSQPHPGGVSVQAPSWVSELCIRIHCSLQQRSAHLTLLFFHLSPGAPTRIR